MSGSSGERQVCRQACDPGFFPSLSETGEALQNERHERQDPDREGGVVAGSGHRAVKRQVCW